MSDDDWGSEPVAVAKKVESISLGGCGGSGDDWGDSGTSSFNGDGGGGGGSYGGRGGGDRGGRGRGGYRGGRGGFNRDREDGERNGDGGYRGRGGGRGGSRNNDDDGGWGNDSGSRRSDDNEDGGERRGGFRGGRGGGRGRGGYNDRDRDNDGGSGDEGGSGGRGRGGRGGGRGGRGGGRSNDDDGGSRDATDGEPAPPAERYVPPEMPEGDAVFTEKNEISAGSGIHFDKYYNIPVTMTGNNPPPAVSTFKDMNLRDLLLENLKKCNYVKPTPIQCNASPVLLAKRDIMACAQTGSGKTAGFLLPILNTLLAQNDLTPAYTSPVTPEALIIAPTRELACQIGKEAHMYSHGSIIKTRITYGGTAIFAQKNQLMNGCNILVATPGRLKQFVTDGIVSLAKVQFFILDEADRMLDMGFMPDVQAIVEKLPEKTARVSGMFSATFPDPIQRAAEAFLNDHIFVAIGVVGGACQEVQQTFIECERNDKRSKLMEILESVGPDEKVLVFCASKKGADFLATFLSSKNVSSTSIHGDRLQRQREEALREFTNGTRKILVATAVAARGLDIPKVAVVVNYDLPSEIDEYVHRIGRTGRVGHSGKAISFYDANQDSQMLSPLVAILEGAGQTVPDFMKGGSYGGGSFGNGDSFGFASTDSRGGGGGAAPAAAAKKDEDDDW